MSKTSPSDSGESGTVRRTYWRSVRAVWPIAVHVSLYLLVVCLIASILAARDLEPENRQVSIALGCLQPAIASLGMLLLAFLQPLVYGSGKLMVVHGVTLPLTFTTMLVVVHAMELATPNVIQKFEGIARLDNMWGQPLTVVSLFTVQVLTLVGYAAWKNRGANRAEDVN